MKKLNSLITFKSAVLSLLMIVLATPAWAQRNSVFYDSSDKSLSIRGAVTVTKNMIESVAGYNQAETLYISGEVVEILDHAFDGCDNIKLINIRESYTPLEAHNPFKNISKKASSLKVICNRNINAAAFYTNQVLTEVEFGGQLPCLTEINDACFCLCPNLTKVDLSKAEKLKTIGSSAFENCPKLSSITMPYSVTYIGDYAFYGCSSLTSINIPSITSIEAKTFWGCFSLTDVNVPSSVTKIGEGAFGLCESLAYLSLPGNVNSIGDKAFYGCKALKSFAASGMETIGSQAFKDCTNLYNFHLRSKLKSISKDAFEGCTNLKTLYVFSKDLMNPATPYTADDNLLTRFPYVTTASFAEAVTAIGDYAFADTKGLSALEQVTFVAPVEIGEGAFSINKKLTTINGNIKSAATSAFIQCTSLKSVSFTGASEIGISAFYGCTGLEQVTLPEGLVSIGEVAFMGCSGLNKVICHKPEPISIPNTTFDYSTQKQAELIVPAASVNAYKAAPVWKEFFKITDATGIDGIKMDSKKVTGIFTLDGKKISNAESLPAGIYIKNGKKVVIK